MKSLALVFGALLTFGSLNPMDIAPPFKTVVVGRVTDSATGGVLQGVRVSVETEAALTGTDGRYLLALAEEGWVGREVTLRFDLIGYSTQRHALVLMAGTNTVDMILQPTALVMQEITIPADASRVITAASRASVMVGAQFRIAGQPASVNDASRGLPGRYDPDFNTEAYGTIVENPFFAARSNPLSTFSIDVDRASYSNVRRFIRDGARPPVDAVRIEELVNYFSYDDPSPVGADPFSVTTEIARAPWQPLHHLVRIGLKGRSVELENIPPSNLVFLMDVSGSMRPANKLPLLKTAFRMLVDQLRPEDRVAIVVYAGAAGLVLPSTPGSEKDTILDAIEGLEAGGSTAGGAGLQLAYRVAAENHIAGGNNRIILATDGDFNIGPSSDSEMVRLIEDKREQGTFLTVLGFGVGNLKDAKMEQLADHGNGSFAYIDSSLEAKKVLVHEFGGTLLTIAKDVKLQIEFNPEKVAAYRLIGYENRLLAAEDFNDDSKDAGELGAGLSVTALYEVVPVGVEGTVEVRGLDELRYQTPPAPLASRDRRDSDELLFVKLRYKAPDGDTSRLLQHPLEVGGMPGEASRELRFAAAVAAWGMLLRESEHIGDFTLNDVLELAGRSLGDDEEGYRAEFVRLVEATRSLGLLAMGPGER